MDLQVEFKFISNYLDASNLETLHFAHNVIQFVVNFVLSQEKKEHIYLDNEKPQNNKIAANSYAEYF